MWVRFGCVARKAQADHFAAGGPDLRRHALAKNGISRDESDPASGEAGRPLSGCIANRNRRGGEPEDASTASRRIDSDLAAHGGDKPFRDCKPKAGSTKATRMAGIGLYEFVENLRALFGRDAHAGVANLEAKKAPLASFDEAHVDSYAAFFGELHGVAHEICENLPQPNSVDAESVPVRRVRSR